MATAALIETLEVHNQLGEAVMWDDRCRVVWWTDIEGRAVFRYCPADQRLDRWNTPQRLCSFGLVAEREQLICAFEGGFAYFKPDSGELRWLHRIDQENGAARLNDGRCDRQGRFWAGSMIENAAAATSAGGLYCVDRHLSVARKMSGIAISNSLCWSPDSALLYHADSPNRRIDRYEFDKDTGDVSNRTTFAQAPLGGRPDGSTIDAQGYLWNAQWAPGKVVRYNPGGGIDLVLSVPASQPTCVAFGGALLNLLFVTSAREGLSPEALAAEPEAGNLFVFETDVVGIRESLFEPVLTPDLTC